VIFVVGLVSRLMVNLVCDTNVYKEYTSIISIAYYGLFACFTLNITQIGFNVFNINFISDAIKSFYDNKLFGDKMYSGDEMFGKKKY